MNHPLYKIFEDIPAESSVSAHASVRYYFASLQLYFNPCLDKKPFDTHPLIILYQSCESVLGG
jgi:hypothetical protein